MTEQQIKLVQDSFSKVVPIKEKAAEIFYAKLFELDPSLQSLFKGDMKEQGRKLMQMIGTAVAALNNISSIVPAVQDLGRRHVGYGVNGGHYNTVASALLYTLETGLGSSWNSEVKEAWVAVYTLLAKTMKDAAYEEVTE